MVAEVLNRTRAIEILKLFINFNISVINYDCRCLMSDKWSFNDINVLDFLFEGAKVLYYNMLLSELATISFAINVIINSATRITRPYLFY